MYQKKLFVNLIWGILISIGCAAQSSLKFHNNGKFKILQLTDVHYIHNHPKATLALENIDAVLKAEKPDLVILTGDVIFGKPALESMKTVLDRIERFKVPFALTFGNHDDENGMSRKELYDLVSTYPHHIGKAVEGITGQANYLLPILSADGKKTAEVLYVFDSNTYSRIEGVKGYDYIHFDQIDWYRKESSRLTNENGGKPLPALAFFHIPLPEYAIAASDESCDLIGTRKEKCCSPVLNSGLFACMKEMGDVKGIFVGHDHDDDYAVLYQGILLAYGRYSGGHTVYFNLDINGARVIELTEGESNFQSWIRLRNGDIINRINVPESFTR